MIEYQTEKYADVMDEITDLYTEHYQEIAEHKGVIPLDPDFDKYLLMDKEGLLLMVTVRDDGVLIGYFKAIIDSHLHYKSSLTMTGDIFFLKKSYRNHGTGRRMFDFGTPRVSAAP